MTYNRLSKAKALLVLSCFSTLGAACSHSNNPGGPPPQQIRLASSSYFNGSLSLSAASVLQNANFVANYTPPTGAYANDTAIVKIVSFSGSTPVPIVNPLSNGGNTLASGNNTFSALATVGSYQMSVVWKQPNGTLDFQRNYSFNVVCSTAPTTPLVAPVITSITANPNASGLDHNLFDFTVNMPSNAISGGSGNYICSLDQNGVNIMDSAPTSASQPCTGGTLNFNGVYVNDIKTRNVGLVVTDSCYNTVIAKSVVTMTPANVYPTASSWPQTSHVYAELSGLSYSPALSSSNNPDPRLFGSDSTGAARGTLTYFTTPTTSQSNSPTAGNPTASVAAYYSQGTGGSATTLATGGSINVTSQVNYGMPGSIANGLTLVLGNISDNWSEVFNQSLQAGSPSGTPALTFPSPISIQSMNFETDSYGAQNLIGTGLGQYVNVSSSSCTPGPNGINYLVQTPALVPCNIDANTPSFSINYTVDIYGDFTCSNVSGLEGNVGNTASLYSVSGGSISGHFDGSYAYTGSCISPGGSKPPTPPSTW